MKQLKLLNEKEHTLFMCKPVMWVRREEMKRVEKYEKYAVQLKNYNIILSNVWVFHVKYAC
jgi:hypothetical protein